MAQVFIDNVVDIIQKHLSDPNLNVITLSKLLCMSRPTLYRKIVFETGMNPKNFISYIRLNQAHEMLMNKNYSISEIAFRTGFSDQRYFATCFKRCFRMTPTEFRKKNK